jgi:hypothetical protein
MDAQDADRAWAWLEGLGVRKCDGRPSAAVLEALERCGDCNHNNKRQHTLVVLSRDGFCEVWADFDGGFRVACLPDFGPDYAEAEEVMLRSVPWAYRDVYTKGKLAATGITAGCMNRTTYKLLQYERAAHQELDL